MKIPIIGTVLPPRDERDWVTTQELLNDARITYRQADYWIRTGLLTTLDDPRPGTGHVRRLAEAQVERARAIAALLEAGISLPVIRHVVDDLVATGQATSGHLTLHLHLDPTGDTAA